MGRWFPRFAIPYNGSMSFVGSSKLSPEHRFQEKARKDREGLPPSEQAPVTTSLAANIVDTGGLTDRQLADWIWHPRTPYEPSEIDMPVNNVDRLSGLMPLLLAASHQRRFAVRALIRRGADPWAQAQGWADQAAVSKSLPIVRDALAAMAPQGVPLVDYFARSTPLRPHAATQNWPIGELDFTPPPAPADHASAWFALAEQAICHAVQGLTSDPASVVKFITSLMPAWSSRPIAAGRPWTEVLTAALDGLLPFWKDHPLVSFPGLPSSSSRYATAIQCLVDLGASPNLFRFVPDHEGKSLPWFDQLSSALVPWPDPGDHAALSYMGQQVRRVTNQMRQLTLVTDHQSERSAGSLWALQPEASDFIPPSGLFAVVPPSAISSEAFSDSILWTVDSDQLSALAGSIASLLLIGIAELDGIPSTMTCVPIGQHAILGLSKEDGTVRTAWFRPAVPALDAVTRAVLRALPDVLDVLPASQLRDQAREWSKAGQSVWLNAFAYPGAVHDLASDPDIGLELSRTKFPSNDWSLPDHSGRHLLAQDMSLSLRGRLRARLSATSLEETCAYMVNTFMNKAILSARPGLKRAAMTGVLNRQAADQAASRNPDGSWRFSNEGGAPGPLDFPRSVGHLVTSAPTDPPPPTPPALPPTRRHR